MDEVKLVLQRCSGWSVLRIDGELDLTCVPRLSEMLEAAGRHVILDLTNVTFMDARGLGVIAAGSRRIRRLGGTVRLVGASRQVARILVLTRLDGALPLFDSLEDALDDATVPVRIEHRWPDVRSTVNG